MADDSRTFWAVFEEAKQEMKNWPEWKKEIQVGIYSETCDITRSSSEASEKELPKK